MIYQSEQMMLETVMTVFRGSVNDVSICKRIDHEEGLYLVLSIWEHKKAKQFIQMIEKSNKAACHKAVFTNGKTVSVAFDYSKERKLDEFIRTVPRTTPAYQALCTNLVLRAMESQAPYPLLYLMLSQRQIQLLEDGNVALSYGVDLTELDLDVDEKQCVMLLSGMVRDLLSHVKADKNTSYQLLLKKIPKQRYTSFRELYRDLCLSKDEKEINLWTKLKLFFTKNKETLLRLLIAISICLFLIACFCIFCEAKYGEIPLLRVFEHGMKRIGTEKLY